MQGSTLLADNDIAHYVGTTGIRITKLANGSDANAAPGPELPVGTPLVYTFLVYGDSAVPLGSVVVRDDNGTPGIAADDWNALYVSGDVNSNGLLDFGEGWLFTSQGVSAARSTVPSGTTVNTATVTASNSGGPVSASDVAYVTGIRGDAGTRQGDQRARPGAPAGLRGRGHRARPHPPGRQHVTFTYAVSTSGLSAVAGVSVTDDKLGPIAAVTSAAASTSATPTTTACSIQARSGCSVPRSPRSRACTRTSAPPRARTRSPARP